MAVGLSRPRVVAVGLGPAGPDLVTTQALRLIQSAPAGTLFLRTAVHPSAVLAQAAGARSFDEVYESEASFPAVYARIVDELVEAAVSAAGRGHPVVYAVPGHPRVAETTVALLQSDPRVALETVPGLSFLDLVWDRVGLDPLNAGPLGQGVRLVDGERFGVEAAGVTGPMVVAQCWSRDVLSAIKLARPDQPGEKVAEAGNGRAVLLHHLGLDDEVVVEVDWEDLDRSVQPDHLTSLWIPALAAPVGSELLRLDELVRTLRQKCPWDREQTHASLTRHLLEESYEVVEAIEDLSEALESDPERTPAAYAHLEEELGDLLFQVYFHATLGAEEGQFDLADVARGVHEKLVGRHPHVFGSVQADTPEAVMTNWELIKQAERGAESVMDGLSGNLPALAHAHKVQGKAASAGFDWPDIDGPMDKVAEELDEVRAELRTSPAERGVPVAPAGLAREVGDLLFAVVNVARHAGVDAESALRGSTREFIRRFRIVEEWAQGQGLDLATAPASLVDAQWEAAKRTPDRPS
ncbi:MAG: nucleoside triphosphate pyrophosphohydrolase [Acidimicrobiales bacterium]